MLSLANVSVEMAGSYFEGEDYYFEGEKDVGKPEFYGRGIQALGLSTEFGEAEFNNLLHGYSPDGKTKLVAYRNRELLSKDLDRAFSKFEKACAKGSLAKEQIEFVQSLVKQKIGESKQHLDREQFSHLKAEINQYCKELPIEHKSRKILKNASKKLAQAVGQSGHRAGFDCTFSAPKTLSIACFVGKDRKLIDAHNEAVNHALSYLEEELIGTRIGSQNSRKFVQTRNIACAKFLHGMSREEDPQLHTHCVIFNMTKRGDGKWRSVSDEPIYQNSKLLGVIYQNKLAELVQKIGYDIEVHKNGTFSIKGYTPEQVSIFSKRRKQVIERSALFLYSEQIKVELEQKKVIFKEATIGGKPSFLLENASPLDLASLGFSSYRGKQGTIVDGMLGDKSFAAMRPQLMTQVNQKLNRISVKIDRKKKGPEQSLKVREKWQKEAKEAGIFHPLAVQGRKLFGRTIDTNFAIGHLGERLAVYGKSALKLAALIQNLGRASTTTIFKAIDADLRIGKSRQNENKRFSYAQIEWEESILKIARSGQEKFQPLGGQGEAELIGKSRNYSGDQQAAFSYAMASKSQVMVWNGVAGAGKTYALEDLKRTAETRGYEVCGLAPDGATAKVLGDSLGAKSSTVHSYLAAKKEGNSPPQLLIVDEAGRLSTQVMLRLLSHAQANNARVLLTGDYRQLGAVEAGNPFLALIKSGLPYADLTEHRRQKDLVLKRVVERFSSQEVSEIRKGISELSPNIYERKSSAARMSLTLKKYFGLSASERSQTLLLADTNEERRELTERIRSGLRDVGELGVVERQLVILQPLGRTKAELQNPKYYDVGDLVRPQVNTDKAASSFYEVVDRIDNHLVLKNSSGEISIDPSMVSLSVFKKEIIQISVGDKLEWRRNHDGHVNREQVVVKDLRDKEADLVSKDGKIHKISLLDPQHLDYAHVKTTYASQGQSVKRVLALTHSNLSRESLYVLTSRAIENVEIITDDKNKLIQRALKSSAKENALDHLESKNRTPSKPNESIQNVRDIPRLPLGNEQSPSPSSNREAYRGAEQRENSSSELESFKAKINLAEYARSQGYEVDRRKSTASSLVMRRGDGDKIVVATARSGHGVYFSVKSPDDSGSIIDFVQKRQGIGIGETRKLLRAWLGEDRLPLKEEKHHTKLDKPAPSDRDRQGVTLAYSRLSENPTHNYLLKERLIDKTTILDARFHSIVREDSGKSAIFPHFDDKGVSGYEIKSKGFTGFAKGGTRGLWYSTNVQYAKAIVVTESGIDALSHAQLSKNREAAYVSVGGALSYGQRDLLRSLFQKAAERHASIIIATDSDGPGKQYAEELKKLIPAGVAVERHEPKNGKDWNDLVKAGKGFEVSKTILMLPGSAGMER